MRFTVFAMTLPLLCQEQRVPAAGLSAHYAGVIALTSVSGASGERTFPVDPAANVYVSISMNSQTADVSLIDPAGGVHIAGQPDAIATLSGTGPANVPVNGEGQVYQTWHFALTDPPPGDWTIRVKENGSLATPRLLTFALMSTSNIRAGLIGLSQDYVVQRPVTLGLLLTPKGAVPATVNATIQLGGQPPQTLQFSDDGNAPDITAGDGLFTAVYTPDSAGEHLVSAEIAGSAEGNAFRRTVAGRIRAIPACATLPRTFRTRRLDTNANNRTDTVEIAITPQIATAGDFAVSVELTASNGNLVRNTTQVTLAEGAAESVAVLFGIDDLLQLGVDGPYQVSLASIACIRTDQDYLVADTQSSLGQTEPLLLSTTDRPDVILTGVNTERTLDTNNNGRADRLEFTAGVDALAAGSVLWSATLASGDGRLIDLAEGSATLAAGRGSVVLTFDGAKIGRSRINGPYFIRDLFLNRSGGVVSSIVTVGRTQAYDASRFDTATPPL